MSRKTSAVLSIIEAAYRSELPREQWLRGIAVAASGLDRGVGIVAAQVSVSDDEVGVWSAFAAEGVRDEVAGRLVGILPAVLRACGTVAWNPICATNSELKVAGSGLRREGETLAFLRASGVHDVQWMGALDDAGSGCVLGICLRRASRTPLQSRLTYERIAAHLGSACRIRRRLGALGEDTVDSSAKKRAPDARVRDGLRGAVVALHRQRGAPASESRAAMLAAWQAYLSGRWPVVDRFESEGRHYVIAFASDLAKVALPPLTRREELVVRCASLGLSNKVIAHELGLSLGSVTTYLRRAQRKLGIDTRLQLVGLV